MEKLQKKISSCLLCGNLPKLAENSVQYGTTKFVIIGESPAKDGWIERKGLSITLRENFKEVAGFWKNC